MLLNVGAMTLNKGIHDLAVAIQQSCATILRHGSPVSRIVLILKGQDDLYTSAAYVRNALANLESPDAACQRVHVVYAGQVLTFEGLSDLMQACANCEL